jgi:hypothetical protein
MTAASGVMVFVLIDPRYGLRHLAVKPVGDLANALHIAGERLPT